MSDPADARRLAETMVRLGKDAGVNTRALITAMDVPLGLAVGNALEVSESVEVLAGGGPADVVELTVLLAREMLDLAGITGIDPAQTLVDGSAMDVWRRMISAQGGDPDASLPVAREHEVVRAETGGVVTRMDALSVGVAAWRLGAGRARKEDPVAAGAGILLHAKPGDRVVAGAPLMTLFADEAGRFDLAHQALVGAVDVGPEGSTIERLPLVVGRVD
jgi:thymidine phosphorylase